MKLALIGNCQVVSPKALIDASALDIEVYAYEVWRMKQADFEQLGNTLGQFDAVISQPLMSDHFAGLAKDRLQESCQNLKIPLLFIHNLHFDAIVPDCTYVGKMSSRIRGPISDYHSRIVLNSFLNGDTEAVCLEKLNTGYGMDIGAKWATSVTEFTNREEAVDVPYLEEITAMIKAQDCLHYFNHPKPAMHHAYTEKMLSILLNEPITLAPVDDLLAVYGSWPVHSWVASKLGLDYQTNFFLKERFQGKMEFTEFISISFETYSNAPVDNLV